jgi:hypothetical protein
LPFVALDDIFHCCGWVLPHTFFTAFGRAVGGHVWLSVGMGYSESKVETDAVALELNSDTTALELEMDMDVSLEILKQETYSTD